jgi:hypothetical protein
MLIVEGVWVRVTSPLRTHHHYLQTNYHSNYPRGMGKSAVTGASGSGMTIEEDPMPVAPKAEVDQGVDEDGYRLICTTGDVSFSTIKYDLYYFAVMI